MDAQGDQRGWFSRNWKWAVPTGGCLLIIVLIVVFFSTLFVGVSSLFKESVPYQEALTRAQQNEWVIEALGEPIETTGMISGNVHYEGNGGQAQLSIPIKGPKGNGTIKVDANKQGDTWTYDQLEVVIDGEEEHIQLLEDTSSDEDF